MDDRTSAEHGGPLDASRTVAPARPRPIFPPVVLELAALPNAVSPARHHTRDVLCHWGRDGLTESCELLVSELVTNAIRASGGPPEDASYEERRQRTKIIKLRLVATEMTVVIEVWDSSPQPPVRKTQSPDSESGRGLFLVEALSLRWDVVFPKFGGKIVWCEVEK